MRRLLFLILLQALGCSALFAQADPYSGYTNTTSYFLPYSKGEFSPGNSQDVFVNFSLPKSMGTTTNFEVQVDTGSRGFYASSTALGEGFTNANSYAGQINLSSSGRVFQGYWTPTIMTFDVTNLTTASLEKVTSTVTVLDVQSLTCDSNHASTTFKTKTGTGTIIADIIGTTTTTNLSIVDSNVTVAQGLSISYAKNPELADEVNFGIGFYLGGATNATSTGPIANNQNQVYNPLINLTDTNLVAGYIVKTNGIQLGLATNVSGYAYTKLNPTGFTSSNSVPDWQTPTGQVVIAGVTNAPGSIVLDSGIGYSFLSLPGYTNGALSNPAMSIQLINSGGAVGYNINGDSNNSLNPSFDNSSVTNGTNYNVFLTAPGTNGIYSQNVAPLGFQFFNSGRNVFDAFDMLYDAESGYMGLLTNDYGSTLVSNGIVFFSAQAGGFPNPVPEPSDIAFLGLGGLIMAAIFRKKFK